MNASEEASESVGGQDVGTARSIVTDWAMDGLEGLAEGPDPEESAIDASTRAAGDHAEGSMKSMKTPISSGINCPPILRFRCFQHARTSASTRHPMKKPSPLRATLIDDDEMDIF